MACYTVWPDYIHIIILITLCSYISPLLLLFLLLFFLFELLKQSRFESVEQIWQNQTATESNLTCIHSQGLSILLPSVIWALVFSMCYSLHSIQFYLFRTFNNGKCLKAAIQSNMPKPPTEQDGNSFIENSLVNVRNIHCEKPRLKEEIHSLLFGLNSLKGYT